MGLPGDDRVAVGGPRDDEPVRVLGLDPDQRALRPLRGEVRGEVDDALGADHDVLRAVAALGPTRPPFIVTVRGKVAATSGWWVTTTIVVPRSSPSFVDQLDDVVAVVAELAGRLVGEQELRGRRDRAGQREPLPLATGHRRDDLVGLLLEPDPSEQVGVGRTPRRSDEVSARRAKAMFWRPVA